VVVAAAHEVGGLGPRVERSRAKFGFKGGKVSYEKAVEDGDGATGDSTTAPIAVLQAVRRCRFDDLDVTPHPPVRPRARRSSRPGGRRWSIGSLRDSDPESETTSAGLRGVLGPVVPLMAQIDDENPPPSAWAAWQVPHREDALKLVFATSNPPRNSCCTYGDERPEREDLVDVTNVEHAVCRRVETGELNGHCKRAAHITNHSRATDGPGGYSAP